MSSGSKVKEGADVASRGESEDAAIDLQTGARHHNRSLIIHILSHSELRSNAILQHVSFIPLEDLPAFISEPLPPDTISARRHDRIRVD